ncbi:PrsW family glutamic-type intramembrane protease [Acidocella sp.]|uniref:PrsW family glutamic-type intramembrane protease n=1 Tax=Acidocella sp. TaxID=50710 RepID=UPI002602BDD6|nr:PrsW family glutamic-type intramembrane protease [Acidocella sp.]
MLSIFIAILPALLIWEIAAIIVNVRLPRETRKRLFRLGGRFALLALTIELLESLAPETGLSPIAHASMRALLLAAVPEELVKFAAVSRFGKRELNEIGPGIAILIAVGCSLGFAVFENKLYVLGGGFVVWVMRALSAVPMHAIFGFTMGSFMALSWQSRNGADNRMALLALVVPIAFHFAYDFLIYLHGYAPALLWPRKLLPPLMALEGSFALILTNHALSGQTALYGLRVPVDPKGTRALGFAATMLLLTCVILALAMELPRVYGIATYAALPLVFTLDLGLVALARSGGYV